MLNKFFGVHRAVTQSGLWKKMKPSGQSLYIFLMDRSERYRSREIRATDRDVNELVGLSPRAARDARIRLQELGLIRYSKGAANRYTYTICDPETGQPFPGDARQRVDKNVPAPQNHQQSTPAVNAPLKPLSSVPRPTSELSSRVEQQGIPLDFQS